MPEFWDEVFKDKQEMWGWEPSKSAQVVFELFKKQGIKNILIPGIGYGRNASIFLEAGIETTGIEISKTAIEMAQRKFDQKIHIYHGSVTDMPFDTCKYDGIFCYALIHLLNKVERAKLIDDCYNQLSANGIMVFTAITKKAATYGQGTLIEKDRFEMFGGVKMFFYDAQTIQEEFKKIPQLDVQEITESYPFYLIICKKI